MTSIDCAVKVQLRREVVDYFGYVTVACIPVFFASWGLAGSG
jgi:hypothetical protein